MSPRSLRVYITGLNVVLAAVLAVVLIGADDLSAGLPEWIFFTAVFALVEMAALFWHHARGREGLSASEAVLLPMLVGLSPAQAIIGVAAGITIAGFADRRMDKTKAFFNIGQYGCSAAAAAGVWTLLRDDSTLTLTPRNAVVAVAGVLVFALLTHLLVDIAIALAEQVRFEGVTRRVASAIGWNLIGNLSLGLMFAASFVANRWTVALFILPLAAFYFGYRAVLSQRGEQQRVEDLYTATRALAANPDLKGALEEFLRAVADVASASEARCVVIEDGDKLVWAGVRAGEVTAALDPVLGGPIETLMDVMRSGSQSVLVSQDDEREHAALRDALGFGEFVATPLIEGDKVLGCLLVADRLGAGEFADPDARLLEALANELVVTLDSHRLFQEVSEERERFRRIFEGSKEGVCLLDAQGKVLAWNPALAQISGFESEDVVGRLWSERLLLRDREERRLEGMDLVDPTKGGELELVTRDGPTRWVAVQAGAVQRSDERGWVVLFRDITAQHLAEEAKSDFLATISHELRTPLTTIKGALHAMNRTDGLTPDLQAQMLGVIGRGSDRLERLVMNLLAVSQLETGAAPSLFRDHAKLGEIVAERVERVLADHPHVRIDEQDADIEIRCDREKISHAIEHLLENALKFGGPEATITIEMRRENGWGRVSVHDEGPGIAVADQERIFSRFVRLGDVMTRETQGAGVGLFIAKRVVDAMDGEIWVESDLGQGSTFHIRIPLARPEAVADSSA